jgi:hypothetical protein
MQGALNESDEHSSHHAKDTRVPPPCPTAATSDAYLRWLWHHLEGAPLLCAQQTDRAFGRYGSPRSGRDKEAGQLASNPRA